MRFRLIGVSLALLCGCGSRVTIGGDDPGDQTEPPKPLREVPPSAEPCEESYSLQATHAITSLGGGLVDLAAGGVMLAGKVDDTFVLGGETLAEVSGSGGATVLATLDEQGAVVETALLEGFAAQDFARDAEHGLLLFATGCNDDAVVPPASGDSCVLKLDPQGNPLWGEIGWFMRGMGVAPGGRTTVVFAPGLVLSISADGEALWEQVVDDHTTLDVAASDAGVAVAAAGSTIHMGELSSSSGVAVGFFDDEGAPRWLVGFDTVVREIALTPGGHAYLTLASEEGVELVQLDADDGSERWRVALPGAGLPYLAVDGDDAAIVGQTDGSLAKVRSDGVVCALHGPIEHRIPPTTVFDDGDVTVDGAGRVYLATPGTQSTLLIYELEP